MTTAFPGAGYVAGITNAPAASAVCTGTNVNGTGGSANCGAYAGNMASGIHRDPGGTPTQLTISGEEAAANTLASGYRVIPDTNKDDDGFDWSSPVVKVVRGTAVWNGAVPRLVCGMGISTVTSRITDCYNQHTSKPGWDAGVSGKISWNGAVNGDASEGSWTLVSVYDSTGGQVNGSTCTAACREVWRDDRTGLVWSDQLGDLSTNGNEGKFNWCLASGNTQNANSLDCSAEASSYNYHGAAQMSLCAEAAGLTTPVGVHNVTTVNDNAAWANTGTSVRDAKAGMLQTANSDPAGGAQSPSVRWRLPTKYDYQEADNDGIRFVLPNMASGFLWSASVYSASRGMAWYFNDFSGVVTTGNRSGAVFVRCVGR